MYIKILAVLNISFTYKSKNGQEIVDKQKAEWRKKYVSEKTNLIEGAVLINYKPACVPRTVLSFSYCSRFALRNILAFDNLSFNLI